MSGTFTPSGKLQCHWTRTDIFRVAARKNPSLIASCPVAIVPTSFIVHVRHHNLLGLELILAREVSQADKRRVTCWTFMLLLLNSPYLMLGAVARISAPATSGGLELSVLGLIFPHVRGGTRS